MLVSCQDVSYTINGTSDAFKDGDKIYLSELSEGRLINVDSTLFKDGCFTFKGQVEGTYPCIRYVRHFFNRRLNTKFLLEPGVIEINMTQDVNKLGATGTPNNDIYTNVERDFKEAVNGMRNRYQKLANDKVVSREEKNKLAAEIDKEYSSKLDEVYKVMKQNIASPAGVLLYSTYGSSMSEERQKELLNSISDECRNVAEIRRIIKRREAEAATSEGQKYIDFTLNDMDGNPVTFSDLAKGHKLVLIDFWASWCGPCRAEMPNVVKAYEQFRDKGLEIVGVSLDKDKAKWEKACKDLNITWPQMSNLKGWNNKVTQIYCVRGIPATVLISEDGTILKRNARGKELLLLLEKYLAD